MSTLPSELTLDSTELRSRIERFQEARTRILEQVHRVIVGQDEVLEQILIALFVGGHCLITGLPGTAKTLMVRTIAQTLGLIFKRIQFTPDLMPSDITGTDIIEEDPTTGHRRWTFVPGPIFGNILLADEINRTPPKTQSALLEAMQELSCTVRGNNYKLPAPFFVLATQNPIELEGTYPLPEAQLDRFMFHIVIEHPPEHEELEVVRTTTAIQEPVFNRPVTGPDLVAFQRLVRRVPIADAVLRYALSIVRTSRPKSPQAPESVKKWVQFGASVRAAQYLVLGAKARALTSGRYHVSFDDIKSVAHPVLRHRVLTNFRAESEGVTTDQIIDELLQRVPVPASGM
jgi:MoxR-like ATPase